MTPSFRARRRAEEFDALVASASDAPTPSTRDAELLALVGALRAAPPVTARPEFVAELRERLLVEADTVLVPTDADKLRLPARRTRRERRRVALVGGLAVAAATTTVAVASQSALPGDSLYPLKRTLESAHAGLSVGEHREGRTLLGSASSRLDEADALSRSDDPDSRAHVAGTLDTFTEQASAGAELLVADYQSTGRESSIATWHDFASSGITQLEQLAPEVPADAREELVRAARTLSKIDAAASELCPTCGGNPIESVPSVLADDSFDLPALPQVTPSAAGTARGTNAPEPTDGPVLPDVDGETLSPGSVRSPSARASGTPSSATPSSGTPTSGDATDDRNPLQELTNGVIGGLTGGTTSSTSPSPSLPVVDGLVDDVGDIVGGLLDGAVDPLTGRSATP